MNTLHISTAGPEVASALAVLGASQPNAEFTLTINGGNLAALLAGAAIAGAPAVVNAPMTAVAPVFAKPAVVAPTTEGVLPGSMSVEMGKRIRRTKEENAAGLTIEEAEAFRASGQTDAMAFKAALDGNAPSSEAADATGGVVATAPTSAPEAPAPAPTSTVTESGPVTEADLRTAAAAAVGAGKKAEVMKIATDAGVKKWSELDPSKYGEVLTALTALMVVG